MTVFATARRGRARSVPTARRMIGLFAAVVTAAGAIGGFARDAPAIRAAEGPQVAIMLDGLCSELGTGSQLTVNFSGPDGLVGRLRGAGWPEDAIEGFSYRGGTLDVGRWLAVPYTCADSRDQGLAKDVDILEEQVRAITNARPSARVNLIGFSQGGLVAFGYLARLATSGQWALPGGASLSSVITLDAPLGGAPFVDLLCAYAPDVCGGTPVPNPNSSLQDMSEIWDTSVGYPAGAKRSVASRVANSPSANQSVAAMAAAHGVTVLTIGNVRDWLYAPAGPLGGALTFLDSQWLTTDPKGAGIHARAIDAGPSACPSQGGANLAASFGCNHALVMRDPAAASAILAVLDRRTPDLASSCLPGKGGCLSLPPRPAIKVKSSIAANIVSGGGNFGTSAVQVKTGGRATLLFSTSPAVPGAIIQIWGRAAKGSYRFMTSRVADRHGIVRYYTPPISAWAAIQGRFTGDYVNGPGVSPARVVTVR